MAGNYDVFDTKKQSSSCWFFASCPWNSLIACHDMKPLWWLSIRQVNLKITGLSAILVK